MSAFSVSIADFPTKPHNACFVEVAEAFSRALTTLGHTVGAGRALLFGANEARLGVRLTPDAILYNAEPIADAPDPTRLIASTQHTVWDYAATNVARWRTLGVDAVHCPIGYVAGTPLIAAAPEEDVDVLFYGWINPRRLEILRELQRVGLRVVALPPGSYGEMRDRWIARSKVVLNLHFYEHSIFEIFRVSHLLANSKCVVTEDGGADAELAAFGARACVSMPRAHIVNACRMLVSDAAARHVRAQRGHVEFKKLDLVESVRAALIASEV